MLSGVCGVGLWPKISRKETPPLFSSVVFRGNLIVLFNWGPYLVQLKRGPSSPVNGLGTSVVCLWGEELGETCAPCWGSSIHDCVLVF